MLNLKSFLKSLPRNHILFPVPLYVHHTSIFRLFFFLFLLFPLFSPFYLSSWKASKMVVKSYRFNFMHPCSFNYKKISAEKGKLLMTYRYDVIEENKNFSIWVPWGRQGGVCVRNLLGLETHPHGEVPEGLRGPHRPSCRGAPGTLSCRKPPFN